MRPLVIVAALGLAAQAAFADEQPAGARSADTIPGCAGLLADVRAADSPASRRAAAVELMRMGNHPDCLAETLAQQDAFGRFVREFESRRTDKQAGSNPGSGGATNLVSKGTTSRILSVAAEYGALTESVNRQIVTVQGSLDGIPAALVRHQLVRYCPIGSEAGKCLHHDALEALRKVSYSVSFDTSANAQQLTAVPSGTPSSGTAQPVTFDATGQPITGATVRFIALNARDAFSKAFQDLWSKRVKAAGLSDPLVSSGSAALASMQALLNAVEPTEAYKKWVIDTG